VRFEIVAVNMASKLAISGLRVAMRAHGRRGIASATKPLLEMKTFNVPGMGDSIREVRMDKYD